jgi:hypothetical protein
MRWVFSIYLVLQASLGLGVHSACNRNEYQKQKNKCFWGLECGRCVELTTLPPSVSRLPRQCGILIISQLFRPPRPGTGIAFLLFLINRIGINSILAVVTRRTMSRPFPWCWVMSFEEKEDGLGVEREGVWVSLIFLLPLWQVSGGREGRREKERKRGRVCKRYHILRLMECRNIDSSGTQE